MVILTADIDNGGAPLILRKNGNLILPDTLTFGDTGARLAAITVTESGRWRRQEDCYKFPGNMRLNLWMRILMKLKR